MTRALVRTVLSKYADVSPSEWAFEVNSYGRPQIAGQHCENAELLFNISHTQGLIALAVTWNRAIGVDVENTDRATDFLGIANNVFAPIEVNDIASIPSSRKQERFFEYWVCKESYVKARGMGLSIPLDSFSFTFSDDCIHLSLRHELADDADSWSFRQYRPSSEHLLCVCCERSGCHDPDITIRELLLLESEELLDIPIIRESVRIFS